jgi:DNA invertase Pin-like site-specific DNA recombinase
MPKKAKPTRRRRAAIYVRISKDKRQRAGVRRQERECRELAERLRWDVVVVFSDNDREASSGKPRPGYLQMVEAMKSGQIDAVVGWHSDRIYRRPDELEDLIKVVEELDIKIQAVVMGQIDLSTASGRAAARMFAVMAKYEVELKGERQSSQLHDRAKDGLPTGGGTRPFGWESGGMKKRPKEAAVVSQLVDRAIAGETVGALTEWLIASGVPSVSGKPWHPTVVRRLLMNPRIAGLATWKGDIIGPGKWDALVDEARFRRVTEVLKYRGPARANTARIALLPGLIWCGVCGYELVTFRQQRDCPPPGIRTYGCRTRYMPGRPGHLKSCGRISIKAEAIEEDVAERVIARLLQPKAQRVLARAAARSEGVPIDNAAVRIGELEEKLRQLGVDFADGLIGRPEFLAARDRTTELLNVARSAAGAPTIQLPIGDSRALVRWWEGASLGQKQALLGQRIERVVVGPHSGRRSEYDRSRVEIVWR